MANPKVEDITIRPLNTKSFKVSIYGDTMIQNQMSEKTKKQMIDTQMGTKKVGKREKKDPKADFENSLHIVKSGKFTYKSSNNLGLGEVDFNGEVGFPAYGVKRAIVDSARNVDGITMTLLRGAIFIQGNEDDLVKLNYKKIIMREDPVVVSNGRKDLRYRGELRDWDANLTIEYNADVISAEQIVNLLNIAGFSTGLGEMRPGKTGGNYGRFKVKETK
jgi:hypothetical protein